MKGKELERKVKNLLTNGEVIRLRDVPKINGRKTKGTQNPCDMIYIKEDIMYLIEVKNCKAKSLPYSRLTQLDDLTRIQKIGNKYVKCVFVVNFEFLKPRERLKYIDLESLVHYMNTNTRKSISHEYEGFKGVKEIV